MNKKIIVIFSIILLGVLLVVLNSTVFIVRTINTEYPITDKFTSQDILDNCKEMYKMNIFTVSERRSTINIEKNNPYAKVVSIERTFPNGIMVYTDLRIPIMTISIANSTDMLLVDNQLKILEIVSSGSDLPYTNIGGIVFNNKDYSALVGEFVTINKNIYEELYNIVKIIQLANSSLRGEAFYEFIKAIHFYDESTVRITIDDDTYFEIGRATAEKDLIIALSQM